jgi:hypothetical protein
VFQKRRLLPEQLLQTLPRLCAKKVFHPAPDGVLKHNIQTFHPERSAAMV